MPPTLPLLAPCLSCLLTLLAPRSWNAFYREIHEDLVKEHADLMVSLGLRDAGQVPPPGRPPLGWRPQRLGIARW